MSKALFALFITMALLNSSYCEDVPEEDGVLVLSESNFDQVVNSNQYVLVEFYAPWCGHCKSLAPEYAKAAQALAGQIPLAKVDATQNKDLASRFGVSGYPTLKFFVDGQASEYNGGRTESTIVSWLKKKTSPATVLRSSVEEVDALAAENQIVCVFFGTDASTEQFRAFEQVTKSFDDVLFAHVFSSDVAAHYGAGSQSVVLFRKFDAPRVAYNGEVTVADLKKFIQDNETPVVMGFDQKSAGKIFGENNPALFVLTSDSESSKSAEAALQTASSQLHGKILLSATQVADGLGKRLGDYIGVTEADVPCVRIINPTKDGAVLKYEFSGEITSEALVRFYNDWVAGNLSPAFKSEPVPATQEQGGVYVLVGKSWNNVVLDSTKDVLVEYYAPWCGHCKSLAPIYDELAKRLSNNPNIVIAKMDATANEAEGVNVQGFPTLKFYPATDKTPVDYSGERTVDGFVKFLKEKATVAWVDDEPASETKEDL